MLFFGSGFSSLVVLVGLFWCHLPVGFDWVVWFLTSDLGLWIGVVGILGCSLLNFECPIYSWSCVIVWYFGGAFVLRAGSLWLCCAFLSDELAGSCVRFVCWFVVVRFVFMFLLWLFGFVCVVIVVVVCLLFWGFVCVVCPRAFIDGSIAVNV